MQYPVADAHVDVLMRMVEGNLSFYNVEPEVDVSASGFNSNDGPMATTKRLQAHYGALRAGGVVTQVFALFVSPRLSEEVQLVDVLRGIDCFHHDVVKPGRVTAVGSLLELQKAHQRQEIAGLLSLEGAGCLHGNPAILRMLHRLGVRGVGLTWNPANSLADGCRESRDAALTEVGRAMVAQIEQLPMWLDLAHLGDASTDDVLSRYARPIMASHANARAVHPHPRNLPDAVILEIIRRRGWIGLTFESTFLGPDPVSSLHQLGLHIDHVLALGGADCLGFGSDFDGGITPVDGLDSAKAYAGVSDWLAVRYGETMAHKLLSGNFHRYLQLILD